MSAEGKRERTEVEVGPPVPTVEDSYDIPIGLMPSKKKKKVLEHEQLYLDALPNADMYERSYMHREAVSHCIVTKTDFVITASGDGVLMFWKKKHDEGIEFVKTFRSHLEAVTGMSCSADGLLLATAARDKSLKIYDIVSFDMINMIKLNYLPGTNEWIHKPGAAVSLIAQAELDGPSIQIYDAVGDNTPVHKIDLHATPITSISFSPAAGLVVSADEKGMLEYWANEAPFEFPESKVKFSFKSDTDLYEFAKNKAFPWGLRFSPDGKRFAAMASDRRVRVFQTSSGKLQRVYDESIEAFTQNVTGATQNMMEVGRKIANEKDLLKAQDIRRENVLFDESGNFLLYPSMSGVKCINLLTNKCVRTLGKGENQRILSIALFQGIAKKQGGGSQAVTLEMEVAENPGMGGNSSDPTLFCTAFAQKRFSLYSRREPEETGGEIGRDVFNLKPTREEQLAATGASKQRKLADNVTIHTSLGDIHIKLFLAECPKTVENFVTHCRDGYFNGLVWHRVIAGFMIQTGDPLGNGTGGESIWGGEFEDEFNDTLRHDRPYTVSMANAGPNTNGSQFFVTLVPTPWLDNKHTVFGRVIKGQEACQAIGNASVDKEDKPLEDIKIINVSF